MSAQEIPLREAEDVVADLKALPGVVGAVVSTSNPGMGERRTVRVTLALGYVRIPPRVMRTLTDRDLGVRDVSRQGEQLQVLAI